MQGRISNSATAAPATTQEVLLRTLASDIASLQHGSTTPAPQQLTAQFAANTSSDDAPPAQTEGKGMRLILALLFLAGVGIAIYYFVYPSFVEVRP